MSRLPWVTWLAIVGFATGDAFAFPARTPEQDALATSRYLRPIPDERWSEIAGDRASQAYEIVKDDTLYDVSKRLFGDASLWPKVWALNNQSITNPHLIRPGKSVVFMPGSGSSLPAIAIANAPPPGAEAPVDLNLTPMTSAPESALTMTDGATTGTAIEPELPPQKDAAHEYAMLFDPEAREKAARAEKKRQVSNEWMRLPRQSWEKSKTQLPKHVDALGFDRRSRVTVRKLQGFDPELVAATDEFQPLGTVEYARTPSSMLAMGDAIYIRSEGELQVGESYSITSEPMKFGTAIFGRGGLGYQMLGKVRITGVKEGLYIGTIISSQYTVSRGDFLIATPARIRNMRPIAASGTVNGHILIDKRTASFAAAQYKYVFLDRGTEDGVEPGMVFRAYQRKDPQTNKTISDSDFINDADIQVIQTSERFSLGMVIGSNSQIEDGTDVTLLTNVSDLLKRRGTRTRPMGTGATRAGDLEALDQIDSSGELGQEEENELRQLETHGEPEPEMAPDEELSDDLETVEVPALGDSTDDGAAEVIPEPPAEDPPMEDAADIPPPADETSAEALPAEQPAQEEDLDSAFQMDDLPPPPADGASPETVVNETTPPAEGTTAPETAPEPTSSALDELEDLAPPPVENAVIPEPIPTPTPDQSAQSSGSDPNDLDQLLDSP